MYFEERHGDVDSVTVPDWRGVMSRVLLDPALYRKARNRAKRGNVGVCPFTSKGEVGYFIMQRTLTKLQRLCYDYSIPADFIKVDKKARYGFFYLSLYGAQARKWTSVLRGIY